MERRGDLITLCKACRAEVLRVWKPTSGQMYVDSRPVRAGGFVLRGMQAIPYDSRVHDGLRRYQEHGCNGTI